MKGGNLRPRLHFSVLFGGGQYEAAARVSCPPARIPAPIVCGQDDGDDDEDEDDDDEQKDWPCR